MATHVDLLASYWTLAGSAAPHGTQEYSPFDFKDRVVAASQAGFKGIGIFHADLEHTLRRRSLKEMKQILDDNGMKYVEIEFLTDWFLDGQKKKQSDVTKSLMLTAAEALGARHVKVGDYFNQQAPMGRLIEAFAALCADAAKHGTKIAFELTSNSMIRTIPEVLTMVRESGAQNGGIVIDLRAVVKLGIPYQEVAGIPARYLFLVELNDGTLQCPWSPFEDTVNHRRLCGQGEFDIRGFINCLQGAGYKGPWAIEVLSAELRKKSLEEAATSAYNTTIAQFSLGTKS